MTDCGRCVQVQDITSTATYGGALSLGKRMHIRVKVLTHQQPREPMQHVVASRCIEHCRVGTHTTLFRVG